jgi:hypothetical protein
MKTKLKQQKDLKILFQLLILFKKVILKIERFNFLKK